MQVTIQVYTKDKKFKARVLVWPETKDVTVIALNATKKADALGVRDRAYQRGLATGEMVDLVFNLFPDHEILWYGVLA